VQEGTRRVSDGGGCTARAVRCVDAFSWLG
jgi:hypothetical protein